MSNCEEDGFHYENKIITTDPPEKDEYVKNCKGLGYEIFQWMSRNSNKVAQIEPATGEKDTYANLLARCIRTAIKMQQIGITSGDVVALCTHNHLNSPVPLTAATFVGATFCSFDATAGVMNLSHFTKLVEPKIIFVSPEALVNLEESLNDLDTNPIIVVFGSTSKHIEFADFLKEKESESDFKPYVARDIKETAAIFFSSGTTGAPKGICLSHYYLINNALIFDTTHSVFFLTSTFYWISGLIFYISTAYYGGARLVIDKFIPQEAWNYIVKYKVTESFLSPAPAIDLLNSKPDVTDTSSLKKILIGGASISISQFLKIRRMLPNTHVGLGYGQTECGMISFFDVDKENDEMLNRVKVQSSGRPVKGLTCKILNPETEETLGPHERGELRIKSESIMNGYYNMDSSEAFDADGFFKTGDIIYYDEDFCFYFIERRKALLKYRGSHISPTLLENVICSHPAIEEAVVLGILQEDTGDDHAMALVTLNKNVIPHVTPQDILKYVNNRMDNVHQLRGGVQFVNRFIYTATGKLAKNALREIVQNGDLSKLQ